MLSDYYRERQGKGDYLVVHRHHRKNAQGMWPIRSSIRNGDVQTVQAGQCTGRYLSTCRKAKNRTTIPAEWREALDGPDSGLSDAAIGAAAQDLYSVVWADAWEEAGGQFTGGSCINDVCPPVPEAGVAIVRDMVKRLDAVSRYPLFDLFTAMGWADEDEGHGRGLYYLIMGCWGHGTGLWDFSGGSDDRIGPAETILGPIDRSPLHLDDDEDRLRTLADEWVSSHPPDVAHPIEVPSHAGQ